MIGSKRWGPCSGNESENGKRRMLVEFSEWWEVGKEDEKGVEAGSKVC